MSSHESDASPRRQRLLILVGLIGSGKSTLAEAMVKTGRWVRASQDDAPTRRRQECESMVRQGFREGKDVVVDRVDFDPQQRVHFLNIAKEFDKVDCYCLIMDASRAALENRLNQRTNHPTITDAQHAMKILGIMLRSYKPPVREVPEGFKRVYVLPFEKQPLDGIWTEPLIAQTLLDVETSPEGWTDEGKEVVWSNNLPPPSSGGPGRGSWRGRGQGSGFRPAFQSGPDTGFHMPGPDHRAPPQGGYQYQVRPPGQMTIQQAFRVQQNPGHTGIQPNGGLGSQSDSWRSPSTQSHQQ